MHLLLLAKYCDGIIDNVQHCKDEFHDGSIGFYRGQKRKASMHQFVLARTPFLYLITIPKNKTETLSQLNITRAKRASVYLTLHIKKQLKKRKQTVKMRKQII